MPWSIDARIPVIYAGESLANDERAGRAALVSRAPPPPLPGWAVAGVSFDGNVTTHRAGCACCAGRTPAAQALDRLFQARARGACAWFDRVVVTSDAGDEVRAALAEDALSAARFRLG